MSKYHYLGPTIDHTLLSPNGRVSKRARAAMIARETARLFPPGWNDEPVDEAAVRANRAKSLRGSAANLRALAAKGMSKRKFLREAERLEQEANALDNGEASTTT